MMFKEEALRKPHYDAGPLGDGRATRLTAAEETALGLKIAQDNCPASRARLARANLHLVPAIATNFAGRGLSWAQLIEAGNTGLMNAAGEFDPAQGARFSTAASWWIKHTIRKALQNERRSRLVLHSTTRH